VSAGESTPAWIFEVYENMQRRNAPPAAPPPSDAFLALAGRVERLERGFCAVVRGLAWLGIRCEGADEQRAEHWREAGTIAREILGDAAEKASVH